MKKLLLSALLGLALVTTSGDVIPLPPNCAVIFKTAPVAVIVTDDGQQQTIPMDMISGFIEKEDTGKDKKEIGL